MTKDIRIDFNEVGHDNVATTLVSSAAPGVDLSIGAPLVAGDGYGNLCEATVESVKDGVVILLLDPGTFRAGLTG